MMEGAARQSASSDGDCSSEDDESNSVLPNGRSRKPMYPMPQSHWFPRSISFVAYVAPRVSRQRTGGNAPVRASRQQVGANAPRLHIQVTRPVHSAPRPFTCCVFVRARTSGLDVFRFFTALLGASSVFCYWLFACAAFFVLTASGIVR
jgi:hypothetical protein